MPTVADQFLPDGYVYDERLQGYVKAGEVSEIDRPVWDEWMGDSTQAGKAFTGKTYYALDAEIWLGPLGETIIRIVADWGGRLQAALQGWTFLGYTVYTHKTNANLYKVRWGFAPPEDTQISGLGLVLLPIAAVLASAGVVLLGLGYVVRSFRMKPEDLKEGDLFGVKGIFSSVKGLLTLVIIVLVIWKVLPMLGGEKE